MSVKINLGAWNSVFAVPSKIVDEGLKLTDGVKLKALLYILRNCDRELSNEEISNGTGINVTDVPEAVEYWVNMGILSENACVYTPSGAQNTEVEQAQTEATVDTIAEKVETAKQKFAITKPQKPDYVFTAQQLAVDSELKILVEEAQSALGKVLSNSDIATLLMLKDTCGLPLDVILMIVHYCISIDKANMRMIEKIGISWADEEIYTVEAADNKIREIKRRSTNFALVSSVFGMKNQGSPTKKQLEYGDKWVGEWKFSTDMLREAYERCVDAKGEIKFTYIDGILKRWHSNDIKSPDALKAFESGGKAVKKQRSSSYDIAELDKFEDLGDI